MYKRQGQLLKETQNNYDTTNTPFKSTRELDSLFEQTKKFSGEKYADLGGEDDKSLGQYIASFHSILNKTDISGIKELNIMDLPNVVQATSDKIKTWQRSIKNKHIHHSDYYQRFPKQNVPFIEEMADQQREFVNTLYNGQMVLREMRLEATETVELARIVYHQANTELGQIDEFINHITEGRSVSQSFIFRAEWSKLRNDPLLSAQFRASFDLQLHRIVPQLHFENDRYQLIYRLDILDQLRTFKLFHSRHVPFESNLGTFQLNHASSSQLVNEQNGDTYNIPKDLLSQCEVNPDALYCDKDVLHMGQDHCIPAIRSASPEQILMQ